MNAGIALLSTRYFLPSVHCFYYSVLQYMEPLIANVKVSPLSYEEQCSYKEGNSTTVIYDADFRI